VQLLPRVRPPRPVPKVAKLVQEPVLVLVPRLEQRQEERQPAAKELVLREDGGQRAFEQVEPLADAEPTRSPKGVCW